MFRSLSHHSVGWWRGSIRIQLSKHRPDFGAENSAATDWRVTHYEPNFKSEFDEYFIWPWIHICILTNLCPITPQCRHRLAWLWFWIFVQANEQHFLCCDVHFQPWHRSSRQPPHWRLGGSSFLAGTASGGLWEGGYGSHDCQSTSCAFVRWSTQENEKWCGLQGYGRLCREFFRRNGCLEKNEKGFEIKDLQSR